MYISITGKNKNVYILHSYRKENGKTSSKIYRKLGTKDELLKQFDNDEEKLMQWANAEAKKDTEEYNKQHENISVSLSQITRIKKGEEKSFNAGYLFLQQICSSLRMDKICRKIKSKHGFSYDIKEILTDLIYSRILSPSSKLSSYGFCQTLLEPPKYSLHDIYRALSVLSEESDYIQEELYKNSNFVHPRNDKILYYDCTNYYFEIEQADGIKQYGKSKEHRPNPIVGMGLFMDADGLPLAFDVFPGNQNEQTTLKPLESKVMKDFNLSKFIFCSDAGLGSKANRLYNSYGNRSYIITHSLKKLKKEDQDVALNPKYFNKPGYHKHIDISTIDETDNEIFNTVFYKEIPMILDDKEETLIVTYSPKYKAYQQKIRQKQIERAAKMLDSFKGKSKNQNDPARFIHRTPVTDEGQIAEKYINEIDQDRINEEARFDGFYAVVTNLEDDISEILKINKQRWEIEENFRIMKTDFEARPVYLQRDDRIKAHFLTCYISLLVYRLLEQKLSCKYTCEAILNTIRGMQLTRLPRENGYTPAYKRTDITDHLHDVFGFRTDYEILTKSTIRSIIKTSKTVLSKK